MLAALASCGGGGGDDGSASSEPLQTYKNCRYVFIPAGLTPALYTYRCTIVGEAGACNMTEPCTPAVTFNFPECIPGRTTCTACPPGDLIC